jgi:hypothetical protein
MNEGGEPTGRKEPLRDGQRGESPETTTELRRMRCRSGRMSGRAELDVRGQPLLWLRTAEEAQGRLGATAPECTKPSVCHGAVMHARG